MNLRLLPLFALLVACGGDLPEERMLPASEQRPPITRPPLPEPPDMAPDLSPDLADEDMGEDTTPDLPPDYDLAPLTPTERPDYMLDDRLTLDQLTMRCTHNSYHQVPARPLFEEHNYSHAPLIDQAEHLGIRAFELDVQPIAGLPVQHIPGIDPETSCHTLHECLSQLAHWSEARPGHHLMVVWIEIKDEIGARKLRDYDSIDDTIRAVFPPARLYTPDDLLRGHPTLHDSLAALGWPTLGETRDRFMFAMINTSERHQRGYLRPDNSLTGRVLHMRTRPDQLDQPWAALAKIDDPGEVEDIQAALNAGLLVASNVGLAKYDDATNALRRAAGLELGVHMRCDDYPAQVPARETWMEIGDGAPSLCNAVSADNSCMAEDLEALGVHDAP
jgi:hypothetical protein